MDGPLKMNGALRALSLKACRESHNWHPVTEGQTFSYQAKGTKAHEDLVLQFLEDYHDDIQHWEAGCEIVRRGPFMLKEWRAKASGIIIPLLEDDSELGAAEKPLVKLIKLPPSKFEIDFSFGWQGCVFLSHQDNRIKVEKGSIKFILLHAVPKKEDTMESTNTGEGQAVGAMDKL
ncbi:LOW QUALITY PROTEIN: hypothetical protein QC761_703941 [Podospora bellae-mahoneyi]|uniref:Uncharacterized protein n=1 Tax=Podospora bellae-mahoneyi TaxID=2093777 RepID=A0ABR0F6H0_9PEZI|nr:LOW QUALITY PROTEIN: hypothetical protein QC761_703941 [Podospora bellae-mahoneyi]